MGVILYIMYLGDFNTIKTTQMDGSLWLVQVSVPVTLPDVPKPSPGWHQRIHHPFVALSSQVSILLG